MKGVQVSWNEFTQANRPQEGEEVFVFTPEPESTSLSGRILWTDCVSIDWLENGYFAENQGKVTHWARMEEVTLPAVPKLPLS